MSDARVTGPGTAIVGIHMVSGSRLSRVLVDPGGILGDGVGAYGVITLEDLAVRMHAVAAATHAVAVVNDTAPVESATVRHLTVLGDGGTFTAGIVVQGTGDPGGPHTLTVNVRDSVIRNVARPFDRFAAASGSNSGTANITYRYSSLDASLNHGEGPGTITAGPGNLPNPDPLFASDMSPSPGSPLIDAGDPAGPEAGDSPTDIAGNPRITGGRRDIGAFEFRPGAVPAPGSPVLETLPLATVASAGALAVSPKAFRAAARGPAVSAARRARVGAIVSYTLNEDASVRFTVRRLLPGRRVGKGTKARCVKPTVRNRKARRCTRSAPRGGFTEAGRAGRDSFRFRGRLRGRKLKPGRYRLVAKPSAGGTPGAAVRARFRIVR